MEQISATDKTLLALLIRGYERAAKSFTTMISQPVSIDSKNITLSTNIKAFEKFIAGRANTVIVQTKIIGQLSGVSYLMFTEQEIATICTLSRNAFGGGSEVPDELILSEIDNILSAAVITELSNVLKLKIYGDVPQIIHLNGSAKEFMLSAEANYNGNIFIVSNANFRFDVHHRISPYFMWMFDKKMTSLLEEVSIDSGLETRNYL